MIFFDGKTENQQSTSKNVFIEYGIIHEFTRQSRSSADVFSNVLRVENVMTRELCSVYGRL